MIMRGVIISAELKVGSLIQDGKGSQNKTSIIVRLATIESIDCNHLYFILRTSSDEVSKSFFQVFNEINRPSVDGDGIGKHTMQDTLNKLQSSSNREEREAFQADNLNFTLSIKGAR